MSILPNPRGMLSRLTQRAWNNQGFVVSGSTLNEDANVYRDDKLEKLDAYYENRQYAKLLPWDAKAMPGQIIPLKSKQPKLKPNFAKGLAGIVASKLIGPSVFPAFKTENPDDQEFWKAVVEASQIQMFLLEPIRRMLSAGEIFVRFYMAGGAFKKEFYHSKFCYPTFNDAGELDEITIAYVFSDSDDKDANGTPKRKWFRMDLGAVSEITYDSPDYHSGEKLEDVVFNIVEQVDHNFGFVQGEWITTTGNPKGYGLTEDITDFIDELCYSLSQSSKAVSYNQDPQLTMSKMTADEMDELIRSAEAGWNLGREGEAKFLESNLSGVERAMELRDKMTQNISLLTRIVLLDPEKIVGNAQSAKAMEVLHGPLKDLVDELRLPVGSAIKRLVMKMGAANLLGAEQGMEVPLQPPVGFQLSSLDLKLKWPAIFQTTLEDLKNKMAIAVQGLTGGVISPTTATRYVAEDFGIEDLQAERAEIDAHQAAMAALNPFGGF